jgi:hypothetical protein
MAYDKHLFLQHAEMTNAVPCLMPMIEQHDGQFVPEYEGWGLVHAQTLEAIIPTDLVTDELVEMSDWEIQGFAVKLIAEDCQNYPDLWGGVFSCNIGEDNFMIFDRAHGAYFVHVAVVRSVPTTNPYHSLHIILKIYTHIFSLIFPVFLGLFHIWNIWD